MKLLSFPHEFEVTYQSITQKTQETNRTKLVSQCNNNQWC